MVRRPSVHVESTAVRYTPQYMYADYEYETSLVRREEATADGSLQLTVHPTRHRLALRTERAVRRTGVMLVGWGGNNGSTFTAALLANKRGLCWPHKDGERHANWFGSITQASTVNLGIGEDGGDVFVPMCRMLPTLHPDDIVVDGWDISALDLAAAARRARVLDAALQDQLRDEMAAMKPRPSVYDPDFIAANQAERATNVIAGSKLEQYRQIRSDIRHFRRTHTLDTVIVMWTANTERYCEVTPGVHDTEENLEKALHAGHGEISPSTIFALAAIDEGCGYINGSPQNTFVPGVVARAERRGVCIAGDDFKSGQTKLKSVLVDFLISAGLKPMSIVSYNHLGNNDGYNLSAPQQFRSKEISKSNVVDDMVASNSVLYARGETPDHVVVIKYVPYVGDSKRAMDEYTSEILLHGHNTLVVHNTCEDSLLAAPLILDLVVLAELCGRLRVKLPSAGEWEALHPVLSLLAYLLKAPLVPAAAPVVNALGRQRAAIENLLRAALGLAPLSHLQLEHKVPSLMSSLRSGRMFEKMDSEVARRGDTTHESGDTTHESGDTTHESGDTVHESGDTRHESGDTTHENGE